MRKVLGALRPQLIWQFLSESTLLAVLATVVAIPLILGSIPILNAFADKVLSFSPVSEPFLFLGLFVLALVVGSLSGLYPALFLSSFQPAHVLKGTMRLGSANAATLVRKALVVTQFCISILLIIGTMIAYNQLNYMRNKNLGFEKEHVILVNIRGTAANSQYRAFKNQLLEHPGVESMTVVHDIPGSKYQSMSYTLEGETEARQLPNLWVHDDAVKTLKMELVAGRDYSEEFPGDSSLSIIINESTVALMGFGTAEETIGRRIQINQQAPREIVGVVKNFHYASLHAEIGPFVVERYSSGRFFGGWGRFAAVRISSDNVQSTIAALQDTWKQFVPDKAMEYQFLDQELDDLYKSEATLGKVATGFSILGIFIACLGLFGMAMFTADLRTKEIGIRKVLGASTSGIVSLLSQESAKMVLIAFVLACPIAYFTADSWLATFTFHTDISVLPFIVAGGLVLVVAWCTVSLQSIMAATANPVDSIQCD